MGTFLRLEVLAIAPRAIFKLVYTPIERSVISHLASVALHLPVQRSPCEWYEHGQNQSFSTISDFRMGSDQPMDPKFWRRVEEGVFERFGENRKDWIRLGWSLVGWSMLVCLVFLEFSVELSHQ